MPSFFPALLPLDSDRKSSTAIQFLGSNVLTMGGLGHLSTPSAVKKDGVLIFPLLL